MEKLILGRRIFLLKDIRLNLKIETRRPLSSYGCEVKMAIQFETRDFDLAILDIMGVKGYELLEIATKRKVIAVMLTAHALTLDSIVKSYKQGAAYFVPKEEMSRITEFLNDILDAKQKGRSTWLNWQEMLTDAYWEKRFGPDWKNRDKTFWENFPDHD
jgi:DNA-binding NtrC family response regulator